MYEMARLYFYSSLLLNVLVLSVLSYPLGSTSRQVVIPMPTPGPRGITHDDYRCTSSIQLEDGYIVEYEPKADPRVVHHMILFGCQDPPRKGSWDCKSSSFLCGFRDSPRIFYAWALNASGMQLPPSVGFKVGPSVDIRHLVVQVHYGHVEDLPDISTVSKEALIVHTTWQRQQFVAGIYLLGSGGGLTAKSKQIFVDSACAFTGPKTIHPFAFRTHAHSLGEQIVGYVVKPGRRWEVIGTRSPQDPQAFYPVKEEIEVDSGDWLAVRCVFNTENKQHSVHMGPDSEDEMCNLYIMYYTLNDNRKLLTEECWDPPPHGFHFPAQLPALPVGGGTHEEEEEGEGEEEEEGGGGHVHEIDGSKPDCPGSRRCPIPTASLPPVPDTVPSPASLSPIPDTVPPDTIPSPMPDATEHSPLSLEPATNPSHSIGALMLSEDWPLNGFPIPEATLGQVTAAALDAAGDLHVLHRGHVTWDFDSFNSDYTYRHVDDGPIKVSTLLKFSAATGIPEEAWGNAIFYMPHGLTIDHEGSFWVTDVALHQVFKFSSFGDSGPSLVLGTAFKPGRDYNRFCQPSSVAVERSGVFFVADGYCNSRILKYNAKGELAEVWGAPVGGKNMFIPHKAVLNSAQNILYVADRENSRVLSFDTSHGGHGRVFSGRLELGGHPYAISFNDSALDWPLYGVLGGMSHVNLMGFTLDERGNKISTWGPKEGFTRPHDLTVDHVHGAVYVTEIGPNRIWKFVPFPRKTQDISEDLENVINVHLPTSDSSSNPPQNSTNGEDFIVVTTESSEGGSGKVEGSGTISLIQVQRDAKEATTGISVGVVVAVLAVAALIALVVVGVLKEHRFIKFRSWRLLQAGERDTTVGVEPSGNITRTEKEKEKKKSRRKKKRMTPKKKLQSLLGPSHLGFSRLKTFDSNSEDEEFPVFNRV